MHSSPAWTGDSGCSMMIRMELQRKMFDVRVGGVDLLASCYHIQWELWGVDENKNQRVQ